MARTALGFLADEIGASSARGLPHSLRLVPNDDVNMFWGNNSACRRDYMCKQRLAPNFVQDFWVFGF